MNINELITTEDITLTNPRISKVLHHFVCFIDTHSIIFIIPSGYALINLEYLFVCISDKAPTKV